MQAQWPMAVATTTSLTLAHPIWTREEPSCMRYTPQVRVVEGWAILPAISQTAQVVHKAIKTHSYITSTNLLPTMVRRTIPIVVLR